MRYKAGNFGSFCNLAVSLFVNTPNGAYLKKCPQQYTVVYWCTLTQSDFILEAERAGRHMRNENQTDR